MNTFDKNLAKDDAVIVPLSRFAFIKTKFNKEVKPLKPTEFIDFVENIVGFKESWDNDGDVDRKNGGSSKSFSNNSNGNGGDATKATSKDTIKEDEIKEIHGTDDFHFKLQTICKKITEAKINVKTTTKPISKEDQMMLMRIKRMEEEEEGGVPSTAREYELKSKSAQVPAKPKQVSFDQSVIEKDEMKADESASSSKSTLGSNAKSKKPEPQVIVKNKVVERSFDSDSEIDSDQSDNLDLMEMEMIEKDIAIAYHQKRQQLLASGLLTVQLGTSNDVLEDDMQC